MSTFATPPDRATAGSVALGRDRSHELLGQVMGLAAITAGFTALGAYIGRDLSGMTGLPARPRPLRRRT
jgi:hypothetical protein